MSARHHDLAELVSDVNEEWLFYVHPLRDGMVILGTRADILPEKVEQRLAASAARFGSTLEQARHVKERSIDESFDFAIVDSRGNLLSINSGIPLKAQPPQMPPKTEFTNASEIEDTLISSPSAIASFSSAVSKLRAIYP
jgi:hypothetical protein